MLTVHVRMLIIQQLTICNFHFLLCIDKMKENHQHNKLLNEHKMMLNLYSTISLSNMANSFMVMVTLHSYIKIKVVPKKKIKEKETEFSSAEDRSWVLALSKVVIAFSDALQGTAFTGF